MNLADTKRLCALISAVSPSQKFEPETPEVWHPLLEDIPISDALKAAQALAMRQPYIAPADIVAEAKRVRASRSERVRCPAPNVDPDNPQAYREELQALQRAIADGQMDLAGCEEYERGGHTLTGVQPRYATPGELVARPAIYKAIGGVLRDGRGNRPRALEFPSMADLLDRQEADAKAARLARVRAAADTEAQA